MANKKEIQTSTGDEAVASSASDKFLRGFFVRFISIATIPPLLCGLFFIFGSLWPIFSFFFVSGTLSGNPQPTSDEWLEQLLRSALFMAPGLVLCAVYFRLKKVLKGVMRLSLEPNITKPQRAAPNHAEPNPWDNIQKLPFSAWVILSFLASFFAALCFYMAFSTKTPFILDQMFFLMGIAILCIGVGFLKAGFEEWHMLEPEEIEAYKQKGYYVTADIVPYNRLLRPFHFMALDQLLLVARWKDPQGKSHYFLSKFLDKNISSGLTAGTVCIVTDPSDPKRYYMDTHTIKTTLGDLSP